MTEATKPKLTFGYNAGVPETALAAWGCRAIVDQDGHVDVVWNRQDAYGPDAEREALLHYLRVTVGEAPWVEARSKLRKREILTREAGEAILYEDDRCVVKANTNASAGYLYVCAYLKEATG